MHKQQAYGTWNSPITAEMVTTAGVRLGAVACEGDAVFWAESRPQDNGRSTIVKSCAGQASRDLMSAPFNARSRVHEYGGGSWWVDKHYLYFVHWDDQRLYRVDHLNQKYNVPVPITPEPSVAQAWRYADGCVSPDGQWIVCVRESHDAARDQEGDEQPGNAQPCNEIVAIPNVGPTQTDDSAHAASIAVLATGADFYSTPRLSPDGQQLSWVQWRHPQMPWDGTELMVADIQPNMRVQHVEKIAGDTETSVMGPMWSSAGELIYASDDTGWWNVYKYPPAARQIKQLTRFTDREVGVPAWIFGTQRFVEIFDVEADNHSNKASAAKVMRLALLVTHNACDQLQVVAHDGQIENIQTPYANINGIAADKQGNLIVQGQAADQQASISTIACGQGASAQAPESMVKASIVKAAEPLAIDTAWLSSPQAIQFPSGDHHAHAFFYPPAAPELTGLSAELPPLIVMGHGGPTSHSTAGLKLAIQFWTSRGIAVVDVNYGGSSGFGRNYRRLLNANWGIVDVQDCVAAARYLSEDGLVDPKRMVIRGGSAGGLTVLRATNLKAGIWMDYSVGLIQNIRPPTLNARQYIIATSSVVLFWYCRVMKTKWCHRTSQLPLFKPLLIKACLMPMCCSKANNTDFGKPTISFERYK